jgi:hypothetical protein
LWEFTTLARAKVALRAGVSAELSRLWFERAFGDKTTEQLALLA